MIQVAVGLIIDDLGRFLITQRADCGLWEFPGGKIELGESPEAALARELQEELGLMIQNPRFIEMYQTETGIELFFFKVVEWSGTPQCLEDQLALVFVHPSRFKDYPFLKANEAIMASVSLACYFQT